jgi:hypothetical protein
MTLRIPLNIPASSSQQSFIDHFNSMLRERLGSGSGAAGYEADGTFRSSTSGPTNLEGRTTHLTWTLIKSSDGTLQSLDVASNEEAEGKSWHEAAGNLVASALASALSNKRTSFFRRVQLHYVGPALDGEYWLPGYRFAPALPDDTDQHLINAERVVHIDFNVEAIDAQHAFVVAGEVASRHATRLALILDRAFYKPDHVQRWILPVEGGQPTGESKRYPSAFFRPGLHAQEMPAKGAICKLGRFDGSILDRFRSAGELVTLPRETRRILRSVEHSGPAYMEAFDSCARLYTLSLMIGRYSISAALAYRVAALDAIAQTTGAYKGASELIRTYADPSPQLDSLLGFLYRDVRSAHFHAGKAPLDISPGVPFHPLLTSEFIEHSDITRTGYEITRTAIVRWMTAAQPTAEPE